MSYQVLARKWRPANFEAVVGQEHIVRSLSHALDANRVHHALLFTGTRGVGKTTIARILAKALNCEQGVSSSPCGVCETCRAVDEGRFIDLIEVDAASRTKVDDTRELLDNVQYAPTRGRYKVYLIDEVHMLSRSSFNALLKTLEEPPEHVKFLLATTDPQQLPVTVLSRCLQFNLKRLSAQQIASQLASILASEQIVAEQPALDLLARAADGSMRDALSLLDQAISHGGGEVRETDVRSMLGTIEQRYIHALIDALAEQDGAALFQAIEDAADRSPDFMSVLNDLLAVLYQLSLAQVAPEIVEQRSLDVDWLRQAAGRFAPEQVQLLYQIALIGKRDLPLAPDFRSGFEMVMLRMLAFRPDNVAVPVTSGENGGSPQVRTGRPAEGSGNEQRYPTAKAGERLAAEPVASNTEREPQQQAAAQGAPTGISQRWIDLVNHLPLKGLNKQIALNAVPEEWDDNHLRLVLDRNNEKVFTGQREQELKAALLAHLGDRLKISFRIDDPHLETPAQRTERLRQERQHAAEKAITEDPLVDDLIKAFDADLTSATIQPVNK